MAKMQTTEMSIYWWIDKQNVMYLNNGIFFAISRKEIVMHSIIWLNLESIMLSQRSQSLKTTYYMIPFIWNS